MQIRVSLRYKGITNGGDGLDEVLATFETDGSVP